MNLKKHPYCQIIGMITLSIMLLVFQAQAMPQGPFVLKEMVWQSGGNPDYPLQPPLGWNLIGKTPVFADLDGDGDLDLSIAAKKMLKNRVEKNRIYGGSIVWEASVFPAYFENVGTAAAPRFIQSSREKNPWEQVETAYLDAYGRKQPLRWNVALAALDLDHDGDMDFVSGGGIALLNSEAANSLAYIENIGTPREPRLAWRDGRANPWYGIVINCPQELPSFPYHPTLVPAPWDWDADGDWDLLVGCDNGELFYLENIGDATTPRFVSRVGISNPWNGIDVGTLTHPVALDLDADGDGDVVLSNGTNRLAYLENIGTAAAPIFMERTGAANPWGQLAVKGNSRLASVDLDTDGDWDLVLARDDYDDDGYYGSGVGLVYFENVSDSHGLRFERRAYFDNILGGFDGEALGGVKDLTLFDLDGDEDLDLIFGSPSGNSLDYFENIATSGGLQFQQRDGAENPFVNLTAGGVPVPVDLDKDGDLDLVLGRDGRIGYIENTGNVQSPHWEERSGNDDNVFSHIDVRYSDPDSELPSGFLLGIAVPFFLDVDGDNDQDLLVSNDYYSAYEAYKSGRLFLAENIGSAGTLRFASQKFINYPFPESYYQGIPGRATPLDFDYDGDQDLIIGGIQGFHYAENTGSATVPVFTWRDGADNPWHGLNAGAGCSAAPLDLEGDGDWDLLATNILGVLLLFENKNLPAHERAFNWAESVVPELLPPPGEAFELPQMSLRYYAASGVYLFYHSTDGQVYLFAPPYAEWQALGALENYAEAILAAGF